MISTCCQSFFNLFKKIYIYINECLGKHKNNNKVEYSQISPDANNEENKPAKILSSEEINEMIKDQIKYSNKDNTNLNEYKIIKQKNSDESPNPGELLNLEQIKNEINQIEFEEEVNKSKNKNEHNSSEEMDGDHYEEAKNEEENLDGNDEENMNINIEELKKDVLESNDDD